jgi:hypothetical protein
VIRASCNEFQMKERLLSVRIITSFPEEIQQLSLLKSLRPLFYEEDFKGPILVNMLDGVMPFVPGTGRGPAFNTAACLR